MIQLNFVGFGHDQEIKTCLLDLRLFDEGQVQITLMDSADRIAPHLHPRMHQIYGFVSNLRDGGLGVSYSSLKHQRRDNSR